MTAPTIDTVRDAAQRLAGHVRRTPLLGSAALDAAAGRRVLVKAECLQHTGAFKARGAWAAVAALPAGTRGVVAMSSGNHGAGVAWAARAHGLAAVVVMPDDAPAVKVAAVRGHGAQVVLAERDGAVRSKRAQQICAEQGFTLIPPYDDAQVIAGQASVGLEIAEQAAAAGVDAADVLICCGGGGLAAGIALALEDRAPGLRPRTVEPEGFDDTARSLAAGHILRNEATSGSLCDAILTSEPGRITFPILARRCGPGLVVSDAEAIAAMAMAFTTLRIVLEPGGAVALAAALFHGDRIEGDSVIVVASGGNVAPETYARALRFAGPHGL
ncbi:MAG: threonine ammonia-lyase [Alkalilacustris sp.]